jgi:hypothetical protein
LVARFIQPSKISFLKLPAQSNMQAGNDIVKSMGRNFITNASIPVIDKVANAIAGDNCKKKAAKESFGTIKNAAHISLKQAHEEIATALKGKTHVNEKVANAKSNSKTKSKKTKKIKIC